MLISHKGHTDTIQVYSVTVMTHVKALQAGHSSQGTSEPITPVLCLNCDYENKIHIISFMCMYEGIIVNVAQNNVSQWHYVIEYDIQPHVSCEYIPM